MQLTVKLMSITMKKSIWLAAGISCLILGNPATDAQAEISVEITKASKPTFVIDSRPTFVKPPGLGLSIASVGFYDLIYDGNSYYLYSNNVWYRSSNYRGPWSVLQKNNLPLNIRKHTITAIRMYRDNENRMLKSRSNLLKQQEALKFLRTQEQKKSDERYKRTLQEQRTDENTQRTLDEKRGDATTKRTLDQQRSDDTIKRTLDEKRTDETYKRNLDQQRSDETIKRDLQEKRTDEDYKRNLDQQRRDETIKRDLQEKRTDENSRRDLDQKRSDENIQRTLDEKRTDATDKRNLEQQRTDQYNQKILDEKRSNENN